MQSIRLYWVLCDVPKPKRRDIATWFRRDVAPLDEYPTFCPRIASEEKTVNMKKKGEPLC